MYAPSHMSNCATILLLESFMSTPGSPLAYIGGIHNPAAGKRGRETQMSGKINLVIHCIFCLSVFLLLMFSSSECYSS